MDDINLEAYSLMWTKNPEPSIPNGDPQTILDTEEVVYLWNTQETDEWLYYDGETADVER